MTNCATIVIPTRNRPTELREVLRSANQQRVPVEIIVCDDASDDPEAVREVVAGVPQARLLRTETAHGPSYQRNRGIKAASCEFVLAPDDDCIFVSPRTVEQTLAEFDDPRVAAVGIPYVNVRADNRVLQRAPDENGIWAIHAYVGAAHAVRRSAFLSVGGYREHFFYMGEEGDLCLRLLSRGWITRAGAADPIHHMESPTRVTPRADFHGRRNDVFFAWHNVPSAWLLPHVVMTSINAIREGIAKRSLFHWKGLVTGYVDCRKLWDQRDPVGTAIYRLHRKLKKRGPCRLDEIVGQLPPVAGKGSSASASQSELTA